MCFTVHYSPWRRAVRLDQRQAESATARASPGHCANVAGSAIVAAMDADEDGDKLNGVIRQAVEFSGRPDPSFVHTPVGFKDWNDELDQLRENQPHFSFPAVHQTLNAG